MKRSVRVPVISKEEEIVERYEIYAPATATGGKPHPYCSCLNFLFVTSLKPVTSSRAEGPEGETSISAVPAMWLWKVSKLVEIIRVVPLVKSGFLKSTICGNIWTVASQVMDIMRLRNRGARGREAADDER